MVFYIHKQWLWFHTQSGCSHPPPHLLLLSSLPDSWFQQQPQSARCGGASYSSSPRCVSFAHALMDECACTVSVLQNAHLEVRIHIRCTCVHTNTHTHIHIHTHTHTSCGTKASFWQSHPLSPRLPARCVTEQKLNPASGDGAGDSHTQTHTHTHTYIYLPHKLMLCSCAAAHHDKSYIHCSIIQPSCLRVMRGRKTSKHIFFYLYLNYNVCFVISFLLLF